MDTFKFIWALIILISMSFQHSNAQIQGCPLVGVNIEKCIEHQDGSPASMESCCRSLNNAIQAGYYCLCLFLRSSPLLSISLSLQLSSCYITVPSLTQCQSVLPGFQAPTTPEPGSNTPPSRPVLVPVQLPPEMPEGLTQPSVPDSKTAPSLPEIDENTPSPRNPTSKSNDSSVAEDHSVHPIVFFPVRIGHGGEKLNVLLHLRLLLPVAFFVIL